MPNVSRLYAEHDAILREAAVLSGTLDGGDPQRTAAALAQVTATLVAHLEYEDEIVYPDMTREGGPVSALAGELAGDFATLRADWSAYFQRWQGGRIAADPAGFATATRAILPRLIDRIRLETESLYPEALRKGVLRFR